MVTVWWIFVSIFFNENPRCSRGSHSRSSNHCVCDRGVYTLTCCTHIFLLYIHCACTSHILMHNHARLKVAVRMSSSLFHLTFSLLMFHPSSLLLFLDGHFQNQSRLRRHWLWRPRHPAELSRPKSVTKKRRSSALRTRTSSLATWPSSFLPQVMSPKSSTRSLPWIMTRRSSTNQTTVSPTSRKPTNENSGQFGVSTVFESSVLHVSHWWFCSSERKQRKHAFEKPLQEREREREEREDFVISVAESMSMKSRRNSKRSHPLQTHKEFYSDDWHLRGHLEWRAQQAILGENSVQRKSNSTVYEMENQNFGMKKCRIRIIRVATRAWISMTAIIARYLLDRSSLTWEEKLCRELKMKNRLHQESFARSCQEFEELKMRCILEEHMEKQRRSEEFLTQHDQESRTMSPLRDQVRRLQELLEFIEDSKIFHDPRLTEQLWQCLRSSSTSCFLEFKKA